MKQTQLIAKEQPERVQKFLFVCAFWAVAADEECGSVEQLWLAKQFGDEMTSSLLKELMGLEGEQFFLVFDYVTEQLTDEDRSAIYPVFRSWLESCFLADGTHSAVETKVLNEISERLSLESEIERLQKVPEQSTRAAPAAEIHEPQQAAPTAEPKNEDHVIRPFSGHTASVADVCFLPDGKTVVTGSEDHMVKLWNTATGEEIRSLGEQEAGVCTVICSADGSRIFSGDRIGVLSIWDAVTGARIVKASRDRSGGITGLSISADGKQIITSCEAGFLTIHNATDGSKIRELGNRKGGIAHDACFSPDGKHVASGGDNKLVKLWDPMTGAEVRCFKGHEDGVMNLCFSPDGKQIVSGGRDNSVRLWEVDSGKEVRTLAGHSFTVCGVCFSPNGRFILSGSYDHTVRLWDAVSGAELFIYEHYSGGFTRVAFHPDGKAFAACCDDGSLHYIENLSLLC